MWSTKGNVLISDFLMRVLDRSYVSVLSVKVSLICGAGSGENTKKRNRHVFLSCARGGDNILGIFTNFLEWIEKVCWSEKSLAAKGAYTVNFSFKSGPQMPLRLSSKAQLARPTRMNPLWLSCGNQWFVWNTIRLITPVGSQCELVHLQTELLILLLFFKLFSNV